MRETLGELAASLELSEGEIYRLILERSPELVVIFDIKGRLLWINDRVKEWIGYEAGEVVGKKMTALPFLSTKSKLQAGKSFAARMMGKRIEPYEISFIHKNGNEVWGRIQGELLRNDQGKVVADLVMVSEVTKSREAREEVMTDLAEMKQYLDKVGVMVVSLDSSGKVVFINRVGLRWLEYKREEIIGKNWFDVAIPAGERVRVRRVFRELVAGKKRGWKRVENEVVTKSGKIRLIDWFNVPLKREGEVVGVLS